MICFCLCYVPKDMVFFGHIFPALNKNKPSLKSRQLAFIVILLKNESITEYAKMNILYLMCFTLIFSEDKFWCCIRLMFLPKALKIKIRIRNILYGSKYEEGIRILRIQWWYWCLWKTCMKTSYKWNSLYKWINWSSGRLSSYTGVHSD